ncbi:hypothetical protein BH23GEM9_BH23GEM9_21790 [soil metagenome]
MIRLVRLNFVLALLVVLPTAVSAQQDSRYTREANKYIGLAMTRSDAAQRGEMYQQALTHLREGMERDADNAKVWLLAGQVFAALGEMTEADRAFVKAVDMHPAYAEEIASDRESAWIDAFNVGVNLMEEQKFEEAIKVMEDAQVIYNQRPEALMNLGVLYANLGQSERAQQAFEQAMEAAQGPLFEQLDEEQKGSWVRMRELAQLNIAQMAAGEGVAAFEARDFPKAEASFRKATEINPHSRDYWFNYTQSLWAQASSLEDALEGPAADEAKQKLPALYKRIEEMAQRTRTMDPYNEALYIIEARSVRMRSELQGESEAGQQAALKLLEAHDVLPVGLDDIQIYADGAGIAIAGKLKNRKLVPGAPVRIQFTLLGADGKTVGEEIVTVEVPEADAETTFQGRTTASSELAGWKYTIQT